MKIRSAVPENGCLIFCDGRNKTEKKHTKTFVKHIRIRLIGGCVNNSNSTNHGIILLIIDKRNACNLLSESDRAVYREHAARSADFTDCRLRIRHT